MGSRIPRQLRLCCIRKQLTIIMNEVTKLRDSRGTGWTGMRRRRGVSDVSTVHIYEILKK